MPHVIVKLQPGKSDAQKRALSDAIVHDVSSILNYRAEAVSVGFEKVAPDDWTACVYAPDIQNKWDTLVKKPGYRPGSKS